ncbi:uncharacterized protein LOC122061511 isoform X2 [Macadamia integrifolia]|uniref:uncharacterized protein LOC122061511 isoform X2 n=1 Tax=Macadamia integrifolia TaxID=60698 RepID=UPI001C530983|nr:uncharacterized protein LOC122061511 isoform X2 [Macadamia integrifolia]
MICSVPSAKSESSWLDRLRSSKGLPVGDDLDLEGFLNPNSDQALTSDVIVSDVVQEKDSPKLISNSAPLDTKSVAERRKNSVSSGFRKHRKKENLFNVMTNVLAELFNMGDQASLDRIRGSGEKKSSRKQPNPRLCLFSASANVDDGRSASLRKADGVPSMSPSSADNSVTEVKQNEYSLVTKKRGKSASLSLAEEKSQLDPSSYSCVEVTIIDTSSSIWKSGKLIFRKGNVWKVRDKRWMSGNWTAFRKKRKASESDKKVGGKKKKVGGKKKKKLSRPPLNTSKEAGREELTNPSYENAAEELCKETPDTGSQVPKMRSQFSRSPRKPANSYSPVFHVQGISASMMEQGVQPPSSSNL